MAEILFDANFYRAANSDLASFSDVEAFSHFLDYGLNEGRAFSPFVDLEFYRASNSDLVSFSNSQLFDHLQNYGINEGRSFSPFIDLNYYRASYGDILAELSNEELFRHFQKYGLDEERAFSAFVDLDAYQKFNPDLAELDLSRSELLTHLQIYGLKEGRLFDSFVDLNLYLSVNSDLNRAFGGDRSLALKHLVEYGLNEGRTFSQFFDLNYYRSNNPDLATAGIGSGKQLLEHFKLNGFYEGSAGRSDYAGNTLSTAHNITIDSNPRYVIDFVGTSERDDYYQFTLNQTTTVNIYGRPFTNDIDGDMIDSIGSVLDSATTIGNFNKYILAPGTYFFHWQELAGNTNYEFGIFTSWEFCPLYLFSGKKLANKAIALFVWF